MLFKVLYEKRYFRMFFHKQFLLSLGVFNIPKPLADSTTQTEPVAKITRMPNVFSVKNANLSLLRFALLFHITHRWNMKSSTWQLHHLLKTFEK